MKRLLSVLLIAVLPAVVSPAFAAGGAALSGQVLDAATGQPMSGAKVLLVRDEQAAPTASDPTPADGSFRIADVSPATYRVGVERDGEVFVVETPLSLTPGQTRNVQLAVQGKAPIAPAAVWDSPVLAGAVIAGSAILVGLALDEWTDDDEPASPVLPD